MEEEFDFNNEFDEENKTGGRKVIEITDYHKNKIKETIKKMEDNLVQPQHSGGRIFSGPGFASKPGKIVYKDFEVGVAMSIAIEITNISYSFNSFKLLPLDDEIIDFFEISYQPCGRVPAGISTTMTLKFTPMVDKDYFSNLKLLSETGMVLIPIECLSKKCVINILNPVIDYGEVILGQEIHKALNLENDGALPCQFAFFDEYKNNLYENEGNNDFITEIDSEKETNKNYDDFVERKIIVDKNNFLEDQNVKKYFLKQVTYPNKGPIESYCKKNITFILNTKFLGEYEMKVLMRIDYKKNTEFKELVIKFTVVDLPIYSERKVYNLEYLIEGNLFREKLTLFNNSNISYKLQVYNHKDVDEFIELNPNLGYIQANSSFDIWIKLKINKNIHNLNKFFKTTIDGEFNLPLKIAVTNINIPLIVILNFFVTTDNIEMSKKFLNFEKCYIDESNKLQISLENKSLHPMKYGFIMLPKEIQVKNNIDYILNSEKVTCDVSYESKDGYLGHREGDLFCKVVTSDLTVQNLKFKYHIELLSPEIDIKPKNILFPSLPVGEKKTIRILVYNRAKENFICEWLTPPYCISGLKIMPKVFELSSEKFTTCTVEWSSEFRPYGPFSYEILEKEIGRPLELEFEEKENNNQNNQIYRQNPLLEEKIKKEIENALSQSPDIQGDKKGKKAAPEKKDPPVKKLDPKKDKKLIEEEERKKKEEEERLLKEIEEKKAQRIQQFNKEKELKLFGAEITSFDDSEGRSEHSRFCIPLFFKPALIGSAAPKRSFIEVSTTCVEKTLIFDASGIDFGEVSVQTRKTINLTLHNKSEKQVDIKIKPLIVSNCFQIINSVREIPPQSSFNFIVEFFPLKDLPYFDELCVYTEETQSTISIKGKGVQPEIGINIDDGIMFMGNACVNNIIEKQFEVANKSNFNVDFEIKILLSGKRNKNGYKPFSITPFKGELKANSKLPIKVSFIGDHQDFQNFYEFILIDVANQKRPNYIFLSAFCWARQIYWKEFSIPFFPDESFFSKNIEQDYFVDALKVKSCASGTNNEKITLEFVKFSDNLSNDELEKTQKRKIIIGNCKLNDPKNEKNGAYEITIPKEDIYFTCDVPKGSLNSGLESVVSFNFKRQNKDPYLKDLECLQDVGMWVTTRAELKITGGFIAPGTIDTAIVEIFLRAYVEQI